MFYEFSRAIMNVLMRLKNRYVVRGLDNIPMEGAVLFAFNHKSNNDPIVAGITCPRKLNFLAKSELFEGKISSRLLPALGAVPLQRGKGDFGAVKTTLNILKRGDAMLIFPEGSRVKDGKRKKAKSGIIIIAQKARVPIVPVHIDGDYRFFSRITVTYGKPISLDKYYDIKLDNDTAQSLADGLMDTVYSLGRLKNSEVK